MKPKLFLTACVVIVYICSPGFALFFDDYNTGLFDSPSYNPYYYYTDDYYYDPSSYPDYYVYNCYDYYCGFPFYYNYYNPYPYYPYPNPQNITRPPVTRRPTSVTGFNDGGLNDGFKPLDAVGIIGSFLAGNGFGGEYIRPIVVTALFLIDVLLNITSGHFNDLDIEQLLYDMFGPGGPAVYNETTN